MENSLVGHRVIVSMSDPWDFVTDNGGSRTGTIQTEKSRGNDSPILIIQLDNKIEASGICVDTVFASFRHVGVGKPELMSGLPVPCNFSTAMDREDLSATVGAIPFIGRLELTTPTNEEEYAAWFRREVQAGIDDANAGNLLTDEDAEAEFEPIREAARRKLAGS